MRLFWGPDSFHSSHSAAGEVLNSVNPSHPLIVGQVSCNGLLKTDFLSCLLWWCSSSLWRSAHRFIFLTRIQEELFKYLIMFVKGPKPNLFSIRDVRRRRAANKKMLLKNFRLIIVAVPLLATSSDTPTTTLKWLEKLPTSLYKNKDTKLFKTLQLCVPGQDLENQCLTEAQFWPKTHQERKTVRERCSSVNFHHW